MPEDRVRCGSLSRVLIFQSGTFIFIPELGTPSQERQPPDQHQGVWLLMFTTLAGKGSRVKALPCSGSYIASLSCLQESHSFIKQAQNPDSHRHIKLLRDPK